MRAFLVLPIVSALLATSVGALAADPSVRQCLSAAETSLQLTSLGKLRAARAQLLTCSAATCPNDVRDECARRISEVNAALPTVVFSVTSGAGVELTAVKVSMDGEVIAEQLDGRALPLDSGSHRFTFEAAGLPRVEQTIILHAGEKNRPEAVTMGARVLPVPVSGGEPLATTPTAPPSSSTQRNAGLVVGGVGALGLAVGAVFGADAIVQHNNANCPNNVCRPGSNPSALRDAGTAADLSTAFFIAGGVLAAAGITTWLLAPASHKENTSWARPVPVALGNGGGLVMVGGW